ncbi:RNA recognition motif domain-containing protein [Desulfovibrio psychrotolerans]|uniref:RNA recognition motif domain-containing protein n=1 Tax=Desulfovibrio psychrotolerans TaxID=415242 RepID=UPI00157A5A7B|nr:RNA-binding protein [Desulfovibrio psychrotolerans]
MSKNIYVGNLAWSAKDEDLRTLFSSYGTVLSAKVVEDRETGRSRGFGFVEMEAADALQAIEALNGQNFQGRDLRVNEAQPRERRPRY